MLMTVAVLAEESMRYGGGHHLWWPVVPLFWLLLLAGLIFFCVRSRRHRRASYPRRSGESVLAERFARGEIDEQEYRDRLDVLRRIAVAGKR